MKRLGVVLMALGMWTSFSSFVEAKEYPSQPIEMMTMVKPGAQIDLLTRQVAEFMKTDLGQPVLVTNVAGGSHGSVMVTKLLTQKNDGYKLGVSATPAFTYSPHFTKTRYTLDDFEYISLLGLNQSGVITHPDRPWKTLKEAFEWAKKENKGLSYMFQGSDDRDVMQRIAAKEGVKISLMPSTGGPSIISAVMGKNVDIGHTGSIMFDYISANKIKILAASTPVRLSELPDVPTLKDLGYDEAVEMFLVLVAPKNTDKAILSTLEKSVEKMMNDKDFVDFTNNKLRIQSVPYGSEYANKYLQESSANFKQQAEKNK